jgi:hypothetical protein
MDIQHIAMLHCGDAMVWSLDEMSPKGWRTIARWRPEGPDFAVDCLAEMIGRHLLRIPDQEKKVNVGPMDIFWQENLDRATRSRFAFWGDEANVGMWVTLAKGGDLKASDFDRPLFKNIEICESTLISAQAQSDQVWPWPS